MLAITPTTHMVTAQVDTLANLLCLFSCQPGLPAATQVYHLFSFVTLVVAVLVMMVVYSESGSTVTKSRLVIINFVICWLSPLPHMATAQVDTLAKPLCLFCCHPGLSHPWLASTYLGETTVSPRPPRPISCSALSCWWWSCWS